MKFIVLLEKQEFGAEVYLADWQGADVPRTLLRHNARIFKTQKGAERAIQRLSESFPNRQFKNIQILKGEKEMTTLGKNPENVRAEELERLDKALWDEKESLRLLVANILDGQNDGMVSVSHIKKVAGDFEVEVEDEKS